jgi:hypothetical protein
MVPGRHTGLETVEQVEQVELESAVVDERGLAWQEFTVHAKLYGKVVRIRSDVRWYRIPAVYASDVCQFCDRTRPKP